MCAQLSQHKLLLLQQQAIEAAVSFLCQGANDEGYWSDYDIQDARTISGQLIGQSDQWVSAFVGLALAETGNDTHSHAWQSASKAADWLVTQRTYSCGFGFNRQTGPDTDSTAHVILLQQQLGLMPQQSDLQFLLDSQCENGGFTTYLNGPGAWGESHADVSAVCMLALSNSDFCDKHRQSYLNYANLQHLGSGLWPCYWWGTCFYSSYWTIQAYKKLNACRPLSETSESQQLNSCWLGDVAYAAGYFAETEQDYSPLLTLLFTAQLDDGSWPTAPSLQVPAQSDHFAWQHQGSALYQDHNRLMTTAHILRVLLRLS